MLYKTKLVHCLIVSFFMIWVLSFVLIGQAFSENLPVIKKRGVLRHLGVPYANFVTGSGDGLDVEVVRLFAQHLGVKYQYIKTSWKDAIGDLTGKKVKTRGNDIEIMGEVPIKGDIIANGMTILAWRNKIVDFSIPAFPTQVWLIARAGSSIKPINPSGDMDTDISMVKALLRNREVMVKLNTCLAPGLYRLEETGAKFKFFKGNLNELAPAIINGEAETTLLDVPDALIALEKWPGQIKVIGPISPPQTMGYAFSKTSPELRDAFNRFFKQCRKDGTYLFLVKKYYPSVFMYYPDFFK